MINAKHITICALAGVFAASPFISKAQNNQKAWVEKSNGYTKLLIDLDEKYSPEFGSSQGLAYYDTLIAVPTLANDKKQRTEREAVVAKLKAAKQTETDPFVKQDLDILIGQAELGFRGQDFTQSKEVSYLNPTEDILGGLQFVAIVLYYINFVIIIYN